VDWVPVTVKVAAPPVTGVVPVEAPELGGGTVDVEKIPVPGTLLVPVFPGGVFPVDWVPVTVKVAAPPVAGMVPVEAPELGGGILPVKIPVAGTLLPVLPVFCPEFWAPVKGVCPVIPVFWAVKGFCPVIPVF